MPPHPTQRYSVSQRTVIATAPPSSSERTSRGSSARIAGGLMTIWTPNAVRHAGRTCREISAATQRGLRCRSSSENGVLRSQDACSARGAFCEHQDRARLIAEMMPIQTEFRVLLEQAARKSKRTRLHRRFANNLLKIYPAALWTFVTVEEVEPTNNAAERSLRGPVIHRKLSHGSRTEDGERFIERALSASVTCRLQSRSLFVYLSDLLTAHARGDSLPTPHLSTPDTGTERLLKKAG
jgi:hypothetical protein